MVRRSETRQGQRARQVQRFGALGPGVLSVSVLSAVLTLAGVSARAGTLPFGAKAADQAQETANDAGNDERRGTQEQGTEEKDAAQTLPAIGAARVPYDVEIAGVEDGSLEAVLEGTSLLRELIEKPPATLAGLRRRAEQDLSRIRSALRSEGYYAGTVSYRIDQGEKPVKVIFDVTPRKRFTVGSFDVVYTDVDPLTDPRAADNLPEVNKILKLGRGDPLRGPAVVSAEGGLIGALKRSGFPFAEISDRVVKINFADNTATVELRVETGGLAEYGRIDIEGTDRVALSYIEDLAPFQRGDIYDQDTLKNFDNRLSATGLFSTVRVRPAPERIAQGDAAADEEWDDVPILVEVEERPPRSIEVGAGWSTNQGFGGNVAWEHRNLWGEGQGLRAELFGTQIRQQASLTYQEPRFLRIDQTLITTLRLRNEDDDAFDEQAVELEVGFRRELTRRLNVNAGLQLSAAQVAQGDDERDVYVGSLPIGLAYDGSDDFLNPTRGIRINVSGEPNIGVEDSDFLAFGRLEATVRGYVPLDEEARYVLAGRMKIGSIIGEDFDGVPANLRFFSGGGGSIRGLGFREAGPLDDQGDPIGGLSVFEVGGEARIRVTETIGIVPFIEAGTVFPGSAPNFDEPLRVGAGLGARYYSDFGPFRLDIGVPVNRRAADEAFQIYISIGQAF